jgi:hypothetical protein
MQPSPIDLTTVFAVKSWLSADGSVTGNTTDDDNIQAIITSASRYWLWRTGRGSRSGNKSATGSPFVQPQQYTEVYDGTGRDEIWPCNTPIVSIEAIRINGRDIQSSSGFGVAGFQISGSGNSIVLVTGSYGAAFFGRAGMLFYRGRNNIEITYTSGFSNPMDTQLAAVIPGVPLPNWQSAHDYIIGDQISDGTSVQKCTTAGHSGAIAPSWNATLGGTTSDGSDTLVWTNQGPVDISVRVITVPVTPPWLADVSVAGFTKVSGVPSAGEYAVANGIYSFNYADTGKSVIIDYSAAYPLPDIELATRKMCALTHKQRRWTGEKSTMLPGGGGTASYQDFVIPPDVNVLINEYTPQAVVNQ